MSTKLVMSSPRHFPRTPKVQTSGVLSGMFAVCAVVSLFMLQLDAFVVEPPVTRVRDKYVTQREIRENGKTRYVGIKKRYEINHALQRPKAMHMSSAENENHNVSLNSNIPTHVAFVCDGNSRWAKRNGLPTALGHAAGADRLVKLLQSLRDQGVAYCTMYGFSTENWKRTIKEATEIFNAMEQTARKMHDQAIRDGLVVKILGDLHDERIPVSVQETLDKLQKETAAAAEKNNNKAQLTMCIAINYGGRQDIINAAAKLVKQSKGVDESLTISEDEFSSLLCTDGVPDPDLIIRTGGERRLSNFLLWNAAYAEIYFSDVLWPDFDDKCLDEALTWYSRRNRRFGGRNTEEKYNGKNENDKVTPSNHP